MSLTVLSSILASVAGIAGVWLAWMRSRSKERRLDALKEVREAVRHADETSDTSRIESIINK